MSNETAESMTLFEMDCGSSSPLLAEKGWSFDGTLWLEGPTSIERTLGIGCSEMSVKAVVEFPTSDIFPFAIEIGHYRFALADMGNCYSAIRHTGTQNGRLFASMLADCFVAGKSHEVVAEVKSTGTLRVSIDGRTWLQAEHARPPRCTVTWALHMRGPLRLRALSVSGRTTEEPLYSPLPRKKKFLHAVTIDFYDDVHQGAGPWTFDSFKALAEQYDRMGIRRVYFVHYGNRDSGAWDEGEVFGTPVALQTFRNVPNPLGILTHHCHKRHIEVYALLKLYDLALAGRWYNAPLDDPKVPPDAIRVIGGYAMWSHRFPREHSELLIHRHPGNRFGQDTSDPVTSIHFFARNDQPVSIPLDKIEVWESDTNSAYRPVRGFRVREEVVTRATPAYVPLPEKRQEPPRQVRSIVIEGLNISAPFLAVTIPRKPNRLPQFVNWLTGLAELRNAEGATLEFTYGFLKRTMRRASWPRETDFRVHGIEFDDNSIGGMWSYGPAESTLRMPYFLDNPYGLIGFARGHSKYIAGALDTSEGEVRPFWVSMAKECLDAGVDGIDLRLQNHQKCSEAEDYGFNPSVIGAFRRRYGVDIGREAFDRMAWRRMRGEFHMQLLRDLKNLVSAQGKKLQHHISQPMEWLPMEGPTFMEIN